MGVYLKRLLTFSWRLGVARGVEIRFHSSVFLSLVAAYVIFRPTDLVVGLLALLWLVGFILSVILHELAHAFAAKRVSVDVKNVVIWWLGGFTNLAREPEKPLHRLVIFSAGPIVSFLLGVLFFLIYLFSPYSLPLIGLYIYTRLFLSLAIVNGVLFIFNILPIYPLDGGQILHSLLEIIFGKNNANTITAIISIPFLAGLIWFGVWSRDYVLLIICMLIAIVIGTLNKKTHRWIILGVNYLFKRGSYHFLKADYERAIEYCTRDIKREPHQANHYIARSVAYIWVFQNEKALADIDHALELTPDNPMALLFKADLFALNKDYDAALALIERVHELKPDWAPAHMDRGSVLMDKGEYQLALADMNRAISLQTNIPLFYVERSMVHYKLGDKLAAQKDQDVAMQMSEKDALTRQEFSISAYDGYLDWAEDYYARVIQMKPRSYYAYQGRADAYRANGEFEKSIDDYARALKINPREPLLYLGIGKSYMALGDKDHAAADFHQILNLTDKLHLKHHVEDLLFSLENGGTI